MSGHPSANTTWDMALSFQREMKLVDARVLPRNAAHSAYYAMFHAARAVLVQRDGLKAPTKHGSVVTGFGHLAHRLNDPELARAAKDFVDAQALRIASDYDARTQPSPEKIVGAMETAEAFLNLCARRFGFPPP